MLRINDFAFSFIHQDKESGISSNTLQRDEKTQ